MAEAAITLEKFVTLNRKKTTNCEVKSAMNISTKIIPTMHCIIYIAFRGHLLPGPNSSQTTASAAIPSWPLLSSSTGDLRIGCTWAPGASWGRMSSSPQPTWWMGRGTPQNPGPTRSGSWLGSTMRWGWASISLILRDTVQNGSASFPHFENFQAFGSS